MEIPNKSNGEHYNLRWNSYTNNLIQVLLDHQHHESLVDVTLCCEGQFIKAHKLILSACSEVFQDMFKVHNAQHPIIILNGIKVNYFKHILEFIYRGEVKVLDVDLEGVLALGESLQVKGLSSIKLKHQVSSEEQKKTALKRGPNVKNSLPKSPRQHVGNRSQAKPKDLSSKSRYRAGNSPPAKDLTSNGTNVNSEKNVSNLESIVGDPHESAQRKRFKPTEEHPPAISNGAGVDTTGRTIENIPDTEKNSRPAHAFMVFANEWRKKLKVEHPDENNKAISVRLGNMWKSLSNETKQSYYLAARQMEPDQKAKDTEDVNKTDTLKKKKVERRKTVDSISHLVSVNLEEFDDDDDLQIIEVNEDPLDISNLPIKMDHSPKTTTT